MLDYENLSIYSKNKAPNYTGVKENGSVAIIKLERSSFETLSNKYGLGYYSSPTIHVYANEKIVVCNMKYDYRKEEWVETIEYSFENENKKKIIKDLNEMLNENWCCNGSNTIINSYKTLIEKIKTNTNLIMS